MRLQLVVQHVRLERKLLKPQVEKRRRERINRCLETLTQMLLQDRANQKRTEKAEILEHTVAFLRSSSHHDSNNFHKGFSTCLQRATEFLQRRDVTSNQKLMLSSRLDMVAVRQHHHHHLKADVQAPLSPPSVTKPPNPTSATLKASLWNPRSPVGHLTCQTPCERADPCGTPRADAKASVNANGTLVPPPSSTSTVSPHHRRQPTTDSQGQRCQPPQLVPATQPMWRPWP